LEVVEACWQVQAGAAEEGAEGLALREAAYVVEVSGVALVDRPRWIVDVLQDQSPGLLERWILTPVYIFEI